jgi:hypothetical protein
MVGFKALVLPNCSCTFHTFHETDCLKPLFFGKRAALNGKRKEKREQGDKKTVKETKVSFPKQE